MENNLSFDEVRDRTTIFSLKSPEGYYSDFLKLKEESGEKVMVENKFMYFFEENFSHSQGFIIDINKKKPVHLINPNEVMVYCKGTEVFPKRNDNLFNGYQPVLTFSNATTKSIEAIGYLARPNAIEPVGVLERLLTLTNHEKNPNLNLRFEYDAGEERIYVANITMIPKVMNFLKETYEHIGEKRFKRLQREHGRVVGGNSLQKLKAYEDKLKLLVNSDWLD